MELRLLFHQPVWAYASAMLCGCSHCAVYVFQVYKVGWKRHESGGFQPTCSSLFSDSWIVNISPETKDSVVFAWVHQCVGAYDFILPGKKCIYIYIYQVSGIEKLPSTNEFSVLISLTFSDYRLFFQCALDEVSSPNDHDTCWTNKNGNYYYTNYIIVNQY